jgi:defect-in-organelle-trafficking protein DotB
LVIRAVELDELLVWAINAACSDLVLTSEQPVRVKRMGAFEPVTHRMLTSEEIAALINAMSDSLNAASDVGGGKPWDYAYDVVQGEDKYRFRVNAVAVQVSQGRTGFEVTIRALQAVPPSVEELGICPRTMEHILRADAGLYLTAGPTSSGKTTTQAAIILAMRQAKNLRIITFEAPIEYDLSPFGISQTAIPRQVADFETAIVNSLRRAPDVIVLGEARDAATMMGALVASETGHGVFTSIHCPSVAGVLPRIVEAFPREVQRGIARRLVEALSFVVYQRLVRNVVGGRIAIRESLCVTAAVKAKLRAVDPDMLGIAFREAVATDGITLHADAKAKFESGLISKATYDSVIAIAEEEERNES